jgi:hypothetical protein
MVMLVLSVVTGSAAQAWLLFWEEQTIAVNETLTKLLKEAGISEDNAKNVINGILNDKNPDNGASGYKKYLNYLLQLTSNLSKSGANKYISREELVLYLLRKATKEKEINDKGSLSQDLYNIETGIPAEAEKTTTPVKSAFKVAQEAIADILQKIEREILTQEINNPKEPSFIWRTKAIQQAAPDLAIKIFTQFDVLMERSDDVVNRHGKLISTIFALPLLLMFWPVDSIQLITKLNNDKVLSENIAKNISENYAPLYQTAKTSNEECFSQDTPEDKKQEVCKKYEETINELASSHLDDLNQTLGLFGENKKISCGILDFPCIFTAIWNNLTLGIFITWIFVSMGSAFWLGVLNKMLGIRSELGKKLEEQRDSRAASQQ